MSRADDLLSLLRQLKVKIWAEGEQLRLKAPANAISPELRRELSEHKSELLELLRRADQSAAGFQNPVPQPRPERVPLSFAQERLWFLSELAPRSPAYNVPLVYRLHGQADVDCLERSLLKLIERHEILRTVFYDFEGRVYQKVNPAFKFYLQRVDLQGESAADWRKWMEDEADLPFDLTRGPLIRAAYIRLAPDDGFLFLNLHHIVVDGWSANVLFEELAEIYSALTRGVAPSLPELPLQYADFALWHRSFLQGKVLAAQLDYWKKRFAGAPTLLNLPTDHPRPAAQSDRGGTYYFELDPASVSALRQLGNRHGASFFACLYAAFAALLQRYSGQDDLIVATPIANRHYPSVERVIGFFVNTLALRVDLSGEPTFIELLERVRQLTLDAYANQDVPFEMLVTELNIPRNLSHSPLFQVMLTLETTGAKTKRMGDLKAVGVDLANHTAKFDLSLNLNESDEDLQASLEYNADLFEPATIERMAGHLQTLLAAIVAEPNQPLARLPLLTPAERRLIVEDWNQTGRAYPDACFHELFEAQVARSPEGLAAVFGDTRLTYRELNQRANQLAHYLRGLGVRSETMVGVCLDRCLETLISLLAIFKSGGVYIPLDPALPAARLDFVIDNSAAAVVLTKTVYAEKLRSSKAQIVDFDADARIIAGQPYANPENWSTPQNLAYVIYTSGSTGLPKGAMVEQQGMVNHLYAKVYDLNLTAADRIVETAPQSFDISIWQFLSALLVGGTTYIFDDETTHDPAKLLDATARDGISILEIVPSLLRYVLDELAARGSVKPALSALRWLLLTGEALPPQLSREWFVHYPHIPLMNAYGPTECSDDVTHYPMYAPPPLEMTATPIGKAVTNMRLYILDAHKQPVPIGVPGELYVGGIGVGRGYLNNPEKTAAAFSPDPFVPGPAARFYKTGDLVRWLPDGNIEFLGRIDFQVKIRGFRIELGEIEATLSLHPAVQEVVVVARKDAAGQQKLAAYLTVNEEARLKGDGIILELRNYLKQKLPDYMTPGAFMLLDQFPLTPNGKIDRNALPDSSAADSARSSEFAPLQNETEQALADIWSDLLGTRQIGRHDNFFELGGDSIVSLQFINRAQAKGLYLTPRQVFELQTVEALAQAAARVNPLRAEQGLVTGALPLTPIQYWFFERYSEHPDHFNQSVYLDAEQELTPELLTRAVEYLLQHHDALRLRFRQTQTGWEQEIAESCPAAELVTRVDLSGIPAAERQGRILSVNAEMQASLNIREGILLRAVLFDFGAGQRQKLLVIVHHLAVDFVSWQILLPDLWTVCAQLARGVEPRLPEKSGSFKAWAEWLVQYSARESLQAEMPYWLEMGQQPIKPLPVDFPAARGEPLSDEDVVHVKLPRNLTQALLREAPGAYHAQTNDLLLTALALAFSAWTGEARLLLDLEGHGRETDALDLSRTVGWFTSIFPVCLRLETLDIGDALKSIKEQLRQIPNKGMGYGILRYLDQASGSKLAQLPRAEVSFNYGGQFSARSLGGEWGDQLDYPLSIGGSIVEDELVFACAYSRELYRRATIENFAAQLLRALRELIEHCLQPQAGGYTPSDFPLCALTQSELERLIGRGENVADLYPLSPLQAVMLAQSLATPQAGIYFTQNVFDISGDLDAPRFKAAWQRVFDRHPNLRADFAWQELSVPLQIIRRQVILRWDELDWRDLSPAEQSSRLEELLRRERETGFDLHRAPLARFSLIRLAERRYQFALHCHHLLLDGWSYPVLLREVFDAYADPSAELPPARPYRDYVAWLAGQDLNRAATFWREYLAGFSAPTPLLGQSMEQYLPGGIYAEESHVLASELTAALQAFAQSSRVTLNAVFQGAWALTLRHYGGGADVVFGVTASGRSAPLANIETYVGLFINALPLRVKLDPDQPLLDWLQSIARAQVELEHYAYTPHELLRSCAAVPPAQALFYGNLRFQNYPLKGKGETSAIQWQPNDALGTDWWHYPLNLVIVPDSRVQLTIAYDSRYFEPSTIRQALRRLEEILSRFARQTPGKELSAFISD